MGIMGPVQWGHYCVEGTSEPAKCPIGTHRPTTGATDKPLCLNCPAGKYCDSEGLIGFI